MNEIYSIRICLLRFVNEERSSERTKSICSSTTTTLQRASTHLSISDGFLGLFIVQILIFQMLLFGLWHLLQLFA